MGATHASKGVVWLQILCSNIGLIQWGVRIDCDSHSAIFIENNPTYHYKTKHINVWCDFVRDIIEGKKVLLVKANNLKNVADSLKNFVSTQKVSCCRKRMRIPSLDYLSCTSMTFSMQNMRECLVCVIHYLHALYLVLHWTWGHGGVSRVAKTPTLWCLRKAKVSYTGVWETPSNKNWAVFVRFSITP